MNPSPPSDLDQAIVEATDLSMLPFVDDPNAQMISSRNKNRMKPSPKKKEKLPTVATVLRKVVQGHLESGAINPALPFSQVDMLELLSLEQDVAQLPAEVYATYFNAVANYPLGCLWIYLNWDKRPRSTKIGNFFRTITLYDSKDYGTDFMCHYIIAHYSASGKLASPALNNIKELIAKYHPTGCSLAGMLIKMARAAGVCTDITLDHRNHFYHNWELFSKNPKRFFYKMRSSK